MLVVYSAFVVGASAVLIWSGLAKIRTPSVLAGTLAELGMPRDLARTVALLVPLCETAAVGFLVAGIPSYIVAFMLAMLGISFAAAGIVSKLTGCPMRLLWGFRKKAWLAATARSAAMAL